MNSPSPPKRIVLGVSASIAAYKAADLASRLVKSGVEVFPILTADAARFVQPATFRALTHHPCPIDVFEEPYPGEIAHIWLARNCDLFAIVPASMNVIARLANGLAEDMLTAAAMACTAPILLAPGMNTGMWNNPATQANLTKLRDYGYFFIEPTSGRLACRTKGVGRMADVETIFAAIHEMLARQDSWRGVKVLITAGPTREPLDPVRYLSNRSSGKMGYALAEAARQRGADVTLVSGPTTVPPPGGIEFVRIETAAEMRDAVLPRAASAGIIFAAAAVADYRPSELAAQKIKKSSGDTFLALSPNDDILALLGAQKRPGQVLVGFAAETENLLDSARRKRDSKRLDWIVANDVTAEGAGFDGDTNIVTLLGKGGEEISLPLLTKREVAEQILEIVRPAQAALSATDLK